MSSQPSPSQPRTASAESAATPPATPSIWWGLAVCAAIGAGCLGLGNLVTGLSAMLVAVVLGVL